MLPNGINPCADDVIFPSQDPLQLIFGMSSLSHLCVRNDRNRATEHTPKLLIVLADTACLVTSAATPKPA